MKKLKKSIASKFKISICKQSIYNVLHAQNITYKKVKVNNYPHSDEILKASKIALIKKMDTINSD